MADEVFEAMLADATFGAVEDTTPDRVRFTEAHVRRWPSRVDRFVNSAYEHLRFRTECRRRGEQFVWASDVERVIVVQSWWVKELPMNSGAPRRIDMVDSAIEVWASADGYHARLDDLAGVREVIG